MNRDRPASHPSHRHGAMEPRRASAGHGAGRGRAALIALPLVALICACGHSPTNPSPQGGSPRASGQGSGLAGPSTPGPSHSPSPSPVVVGTSPGTSSPQSAAAGFIAGNASGQPAAACSYVMPSQQGSCPAYLVSATLSALPTVTIGDTYPLGARAIVVALGRLCAVNNCVLNTNRRTGLPANDAGFDAAYRLAAAGMAAGGPDLICQQVDGMWYIDIGPAS